ncbi:HdeD family acid-resistance protein [Roseovarius gahaiensis]|uniref:HdeD family acid-resistance protein n=1 Tax=Roseovarius gahaiensis TaxID=2716691 RepID=A0A967EH38_9RHOB|nr:HdeD family acid-resistance protein [Roseovarius gahaiensis]NHQ75395.1 HdeD family acid-resistance protein [Roseovarius gahaiensis]
MTDQDMIHDTAPRGLRTWLWIAGIVSIVMGGAAVLFPFAATLAAELVFGAILVVSGIVELVRAFAMRHNGSLAWNALFGLVAVVAGAILLAWPLQGMVTLTIVLGVFFLLGGAFKLVAGFGLRPFPGWGWIGFSGALSVLLGVLVLFGLPGTALWAVGLLVGIDLIFLGVAEIAMASALARE